MRIHTEGFVYGQSLRSFSIRVHTQRVRVLTNYRGVSVTGCTQRSFRVRVDNYKKVSAPGCIFIQKFMREGECTAISVARFLSLVLCTLASGRQNTSPPITRQVCFDVITLASLPRKHFVKLAG